MPDQVQQLVDHLTALAAAYLPRLLLAILTLFIGLWIVGAMVKGLRRQLDKREFDATLAPFIENLASWVLKLALFISVAGMVGIQTTSLVAVLGAAGLAIGLALQGSLSNFAGGVLILVFRPYRVGDLVDMQGHLGSVKEIQIFFTLVVNVQGRRVIIPNGAIANGNIVNYTVEGKGRVDLVIGISYSANIQKARELLMEIMENDERILKDPAPSVNVLELGDSSVNLAVRPHVLTPDYWGVYFDTLEKAKLAFDQNGIGIPFPQRDVHLYQMKSGD